jgi:hypothetical protein
LSRRSFNEGGSRKAKAAVCCTLPTDLEESPEPVQTESNGLFPCLFLAEAVIRILQYMQIFWLLHRAKQCGGMVKVHLLILFTVQD